MCKNLGGIWMDIKMESQIRIHNTVTGYSSIVGFASFAVHACQFKMWHRVLYHAVWCGEKKSFDLIAIFFYKKSLSFMTELIRLTITAPLLKSTYVNLKVGLCLKLLHRTDDLIIRDSPCLFRCTTPTGITSWMAVSWSSHSSIGTVGKNLFSTSVLEPSVADPE